MKSNSKIIFVNPPVGDKTRGDFKLKKDVVVPPQGLCSLAAVTRQAGYETQILDAPALGLNHIDTVERLIKESPRYVGLTATTIAIHDAAKIASIVKYADENIITMLGGPHISALPEKTMEMFPGIDIGVIGEGETTILDLLQTLENNRQLSAVKGLIIREEDMLRLTIPRPLITNLDSLPLPAWDLLPPLNTHYQQSVARAEAFPAASIITSRGCPGKCTFCGRQVFGNPCRSYSAGYLMKMIQYLIEHYGIRSLVINDDNFVIFRKRLKEFCQVLIDTRLNIPWSCFSRVDNVNPEILSLMKQAGCKSVAYGIESGSQDILAFSQKNITLRQIKDAVEWTAQTGIRVTGYFIIGFPNETEETIQQTIDFAKKLRLDDVLFSYMTPYPGSKLYEIAKQYGEFEDDWQKMNQDQINFIPHGLSKTQLQNYYHKAFRSFYFRPRIIYSHLRRAFKSRYFKNYVEEGLRVLKFMLIKDNSSG